MARIERNFGDRDAQEQRWLVANTWCDYCAKADLGLTAPVEYEEDGQIFVEGKCKCCGQRTVSSVGERDAKP
jgi:hypothetical protein